MGEGTVNRPVSRKDQRVQVRGTYWSMLPVLCKQRDLLWDTKELNIVQSHRAKRCQSQDLNQPVWCLSHPKGFGFGVWNGVSWGTGWPWTHGEMDFWCSHFCLWLLRFQASTTTLSSVKYEVGTLGLCAHKVSTLANDTVTFLQATDTLLREVMVAWKDSGDPQQGGTWQSPFIGESEEDH